MSKENQETSVRPITQPMQEQQYRVEALSHAVRHRLSSETPTDVVKAAEKYLTFLQDAN